MRRLHLVALLTLLWIHPAERTVWAIPKTSTAAPFTPLAPPVEPKAAVRSIIPVLLGIDLAWARSLIEQHVPQHLYREQGRAVAPGLWLDVEITRGDLDLRVLPRRAQLSTNLALDLDVRTKLGGFVGPLGRCRAVVGVEVDLSLVLTQHGRIAAPVAKATVREPCRVSAFDLTPILLQEIEQRLTQSRELLQQQVDQINLRLTEVTEGLMRQLSQPTSECLRFLPDKVLQGPIDVSSAAASTWLGLSGVVTHDCTTSPPTAVTVENVETPVQFALATSKRIPLEDLGRALTQHLDDTQFKAKLLTVRTARHRGQDVLAMQLREGRVTSWVLAHPEAEEDRVKVRLVPPATRRLSEALQVRLASFSLPCQQTGSDAMSERLAAIARENSLLLGSRIELSAQRLLALSQFSANNEVLLDPDALIVVRRHWQLPRVTP